MPGTATTWLIGEIAVVTSGNVTWNNTANASISTPDIHQSGAGYLKANSDQVINPTVGHATKFEWKYDIVATNYVSLFLGLASSAPFSFIGTSTQMAVRVSNFGQYYEGAYEWDGANMATFRFDTFGVIGDTFGVGFDGSGHITLLFNGSVIWTSTSTYSGDHILYATIPNDSGNGDGLLNVTYQQ